MNTSPNAGRWATPMVMRSCSRPEQAASNSTADAARSHPSAIRILREKSVDGHCPPLAHAGTRRRGILVGADGVALAAVPRTADERSAARWPANYRLERRTARPRRFGRATAREEALLLRPVRPAERVDLRDRLLPPLRPISE